VKANFPHSSMILIAFNVIQYVSIPPDRRME
jgi:hypothetical protein